MPPRGWTGSYTDWEAIVKNYNKAHNTNYPDDERLLDYLYERYGSIYRIARIACAGSAAVRRRLGYHNIEIKKYTSETGMSGLARDIIAYCQSHDVSGMMLKDIASALGKNPKSLSRAIKKYKIIIRP